MTLSCPKGWTLHSSHCYMTTDQDSLPQQDADRYCQFLGGQLPAPTSLDMQQFLWNFSHAYRWDIWLPLTRRWASPDDPTGWCGREGTMSHGLTGTHTGQTPGKPSTAQPCGGTTA